jgi:ribosomal silencing factor RsfS
MLVLVGLPVVLFPLALYLLALSVVNGRPRPTLVAGPWDFVGALLGLAGFLLFGGTTLIAELEALWKNAGLHGRAWVSFQFAWLLWPAYALVLIGGTALALWRRRRTTVVYNVRPGELTRAVAAVLGRLGNYWKHGPAFHFVPSAAGAGTVEPPLDGGRAEQLVVEVVPFEAMRNATLLWTAPDSRQRRAVEAELRKELRAAAARDPTATGGPAAGWLLTAAGSLTIIAFFALGVLVYLILAAGRRG